MLDTAIPVEGPLDLVLTLGPLDLLGRGVSSRISPHEAWLGIRTPAGPAGLHLTRTAVGVTARAWGAGADEVLESLPGLVGAGDDPASFRPGPGLVRQ